MSSKPFAFNQTIKRTNSSQSINRLIYLSLVSLRWFSYREIYIVEAKSCCFSFIVQKKVNHRAKYRKVQHIFFPLGIIARNISSTLPHRRSGTLSTFADHWPDHTPPDSPSRPNLSSHTNSTATAWWECPSPPGRPCRWSARWESNCAVCRTSPPTAAAHSARPRRNIFHPAWPGRISRRPGRAPWTPAASHPAATSPDSGCSSHGPRPARGPRDRRWSTPPCPAAPRWTIRWILRFANRWFGRNTSALRTEQRESTSGAPCLLYGYVKVYVSSALQQSQAVGRCMFWFHDGEWRLLCWCVNDARDLAINGVNWGTGSGFNQERRSKTGDISATWRVGARGGADADRRRSLVFNGTARFSFQSCIFLLINFLHVVQSMTITFVCEWKNDCTEFYERQGHSPLSEHGIGQQCPADGERCGRLCRGLRRDDTASLYHQLDQTDTADVQGWISGEDGAECYWAGVTGEPLLNVGRTIPG